MYSTVYIYDIGYYLYIISVCTLYVSMLLLLLLPLAKRVRRGVR